MALVTCPNCKSANPSWQRRCWICEKALAPPVANPTGRPLAYPQRMRLVRFEETKNDPESEVSCRTVYVKSIEDDGPVRDYWEALRDHQMLKLRRIYAGAAAALSLALVATLFGLSAPEAAHPPNSTAPHYLTLVPPDNPLAHTILPPASFADGSAYQVSAEPSVSTGDQVRPTRFQAM